jgi:Flp pilus assembly protein TadG
MRRREGDRRSGQHGQMVVIFALVLVGILGMAALAVDVGVLRRANQELFNAMDAGALAGASQLPADASNAQTLALQYTQANYAGLPTGNVNITFRCLVGDRDNNGVYDASDVPAVCNPGNNVTGKWVCANGVCAAPCVPAEGDTCNTVVVSGTATVPFRFGPAVGVNQGTTQVVVSAACAGPCGAAPAVPLDLEVVIDRTSSMSATDLTNAKDAATSMLTSLDPAIQHVALGLLGPSNVGTSCTGANSPAKGVGGAAATYGSSYPSDLSKWMPVGLTGTAAPVNESYLNINGTVNNSSLLVKTINCMDQSSTGTNLSTPIKMGRQYLLANGRTGVKKAILFETDGTPNYSSAGTASDFTCLTADTEATTAKSGGLLIVTVGFGVTSADLCPDTSGAWKGKSVTALLASMATSSVDNGCTTAENTDGDNFFCQPKTSDLQSVFQSAVSALTGKTRLVQVPGL